MEAIVGAVIRISILYAFALAVVRISGKRTIATIAPMDLVIVFTIGDMFDDIIFAVVSVASGFTAIGVIALLHVVDSYLGAKSRAYVRVVSGDPVVLIEDGRIMRDGTSKERIDETTLGSMLRLNDVEDLSEVKAARLEMNGRLSVIKTEKAKNAQKSDRDKLGGPV